MHIPIFLVLCIVCNVVEREILTQIKTEESEEVEHILKEENINGNFVNENEDIDDIFTNNICASALDDGGANVVATIATS